MSDQRTFADLAWQHKGKVTRRERFLAEMDAVIPWAELRTLIAPYYPKAGHGRQPIGLERMLRIYFLQQWFNLSDPMAEEALYDSEAMRRFARVTLGEDVIPDETTILRFRHLLEQHQLTERIFATIQHLLTAKRLLLQTGTIVDATIIAAPSSTKNADKARDPEMQQTRKGNQWHFGMKLHVGTDVRGLVHHVRATAAGAADVTQLPDLLHGREQVLYGDQAYWTEEHRQLWTLSGGQYRVNRRGTTVHPLTRRQRRQNRARSRQRARGEHAFRVIKTLWGFTKVRYRGLHKNLVRAYAMFALANLYLVRRRLLPHGAPPCLT
ncbi:MAG: IS5 family transposase [Gemmatimonadaceae bacterium]